MSAGIARSSSALAGAAGRLIDAFTVRYAEKLWFLHARKATALHRNCSMKDDKLPYGNSPKSKTQKVTHLIEVSASRWCQIFPLDGLVGFSSVQIR